MDPVAAFSSSLPMLYQNAYRRIRGPSFSRYFPQSGDQPAAPAGLAPCSIQRAVGYCVRMVQRNKIGESLHEFCQRPMRAACSTNRTIVIIMVTAGMQQPELLSGSMRTIKSKTAKVIWLSRWQAAQVMDNTWGSRGGKYLIDVFAALCCLCHSAEAKRHAGLPGEMPVAARTL